MGDDDIAAPGYGPTRCQRVDPYLMRATCIFTGALCGSRGTRAAEGGDGGENEPRFRTGPADCWGMANTVGRRCCEGGVANDVRGGGVAGVAGVAGDAGDASDRGDADVVFVEGVPAAVPVMGVGGIDAGAPGFPIATLGLLFTQAYRPATSAPAAAITDAAITSPRWVSSLVLTATPANPSEVAVAVNAAAAGIALSLNGTSVANSVLKDQCPSGSARLTGSHMQYA
jgi:hypothetical protein